MKLRIALTGVRRLGIDTAPLIYFVEKHPRYFTVMQSLITAMSEGEFLGMSTVLTLTEVLTRPIRLGKAELVHEYEDILLNSPPFSLIPIHADDARLAAQLRADYQLKTPDAIQVATALRAGSQAFLTNDLALKRIQELRIIILDELELDSTSEQADVPDENGGAAASGLTEDSENDLGEG